MKINKCLENMLSASSNFLRPKALLYETLAMLAFFSAQPRIHADDIERVEKVDFVTAADSDGDNLSDTLEAGIGTNHLLFDTDGDGFGDGIEFFNTNYSIANPLDIELPLGIGRQLTWLSSIEDITTGVSDIKTSKWLNNKYVAYVDGTNLFLKNIFDVSEPRTLLVENVVIDNVLASDVLGEKIYYNSNDKLFCADLKGRITELDFGKRVIHPNIRSFAKIEDGKAMLDIDKGLWLFGSSPAENGTNQIFAYDLLGIKTPVLITNYPTRSAYNPFISFDGDKLLFKMIDEQDDKQLAIYRGISDILEGIKGPLTDTTNPIQGEVFRYGIKQKVPAGWSRYGNYVFWTEDMSSNGSDFDIFAASVIPDNVDAFNTLGRSRIGMSGNQTAVNISPEGERLLFADNSLTAGGTNLYASSISCGIGIRNGSTADDSVNGFYTPSGINFNNNGARRINFPGSVPNQAFEVSNPLNPISQGSEYDSVLTVKKTFKPIGLTCGRLKMVVPWTIQDEILPNGDIIDKESATFVWYNPTTQIVEPLPTEQILEKDTVNRRFEVYVTHFSNYGIQFKILPKPSTVQNWENYR